MKNKTLLSFTSLHLASLVGGKAQSTGQPSNVPPGPASKATTSNMSSKTTRRSNSNADEEPPAKRPRLKLNLRKPSSTDGDTIAVSRPKRTSATRRRYSEDVVMLDDEAEEPAVKQSPATSSGLSSPVSVTASVRSGVLSIKTNHATRNVAHLAGGECCAK